MKYFVYVNREYSSNDMTVFDSKQDALEFVSSQGDEDGWCQIICGEEIKYRVKRVAYEVVE